VTPTPGQPHTHHLYGLSVRCPTSPEFVVSEPLEFHLRPGCQVFPILGADLWINSDPLTSAHECELVKSPLVSSRHQTPVPPCKYIALAFPRVSAQTGFAPYFPHGIGFIFLPRSSLLCTYRTYLQPVRQALPRPAAIQTLIQRCATVFQGTSCRVLPISIVFVQHDRVTDLPRGPIERIPSPAIQGSGRSYRRYGSRPTHSPIV